MGNGGLGVWEGHEWVRVVGVWAGTEHWLHFRMLVSLWMVVDGAVWWFDRSR